MGDEADFDFGFTDITLLESDGLYEVVNDIISNEDPYPKEWMVKTDLTIDSQFGLASFELNFYSTKKIIIIRYDPSVGDVFYNPDLQALSVWAQEKGWNVPEPAPQLVKDNLDFWKHYWQQLLVDSEYLDEIFGVRENMRPDLKDVIEQEKEIQRQQDEADDS